MSVSKWVSPSAVASRVDWTACLEPGDRIVCSQMTAEPRALLRSLSHTLAADPLTPRPASVFLGTPFSGEAGDLPAEVSVQVFGGMGSALAIGRRRPLTIMPVNYSASAALFRNRILPVDVVLVSLARDAATGRLHLGASHGHAVEAARAARRVIAEINRQAPCIAGAEWPEDVPLHAVIEVDEPLAGSADFRVGDVERRIAAHVAGCVEDGATLQVGIGSLASALLQGLRGHRRLGVHSGLLTAPLWDLVRTGVVDNAGKGRDVGVSVCSAVFGDAAMYREIGAGAPVRLAPPEITHGCASLGALARFTALNSALEVDLLGQANAEAIGTRYIGGIGGLNDFVRGAAVSEGGRSIIALPSRRRAHGAEAPGIVATLSGPATVSACDADRVVTEHGVAQLRGASRSERASRLIAIAHPDDREALTEAARAGGLLA